MAEPEFSKHFECKNGEVVHIVVGHDGYVARVFDANDVEIGRLEFLEYDDGALLLSWAHLDEIGPRYVNQGIGRACVQIVAERFGMPIVARQNDGIRRDDGSHLTGDAPAFVEAMRQEGLIAYLGDYRAPEESEDF